MAAIFQTTFSNGFPGTKMHEFRSLKFVPKGPINNIPSLVQVMTWHRPGEKPLSEPMKVKLPTNICVTRPQWVNASALGDAICIFQTNIKDRYYVPRTKCSLINIAGAAQAIFSTEFLWKKSIMFCTKFQWASYDLTYHKIRTCDIVILGVYIMLLWSGYFRQAVLGKLLSY